MAILYRLYRGDDSGGLIDYTTPVATVAGLTWDTPPLISGSRVRFGVRAFDPTSGQEDKNVDAMVEIVIDAAGIDLTGLPNPPSDLHVRTLIGGAIRAEWTYNPGGQGGVPVSFKVWCQTGDVIDYTVAPVVIVPYSPRLNVYSAKITGLNDGTTYSIGVRVASTAGDDLNTVVVAIVASSTGPDPVDDFAGSIG